MYRAGDGTLTEEGSIADALSVFEQLGAVDSPRSEVIVGPLTLNTHSILSIPAETHPNSRMNPVLHTGVESVSES